MTPTPQILGSSAGNRPIELWRLSEGPVPLLLMGGVHGDEPEGFQLVERFAANRELWLKLESVASLWLLPRLNPDGCATEARTNAHGVDLNRNMPTADWTPEIRAPRYHPGPKAASEPETQALMALIERIQPRAIISVHSWNPMINYNGPSRELAEVMARENGYRIDDDIGYPTPGSLGTWAGWERKIPTITLEVERGLDAEAVWKTHASGLQAGLYFAATHEKMG